MSALRAALLLPALLAACGGNVVGAMPDAAPTADAPATDVPAQEAPPPCEPGLSRCAGACIDPSTDTAHCGACGTACATGEACVAGRCEPSCGPARAFCDGACRELTSDRSHCGTCGNACTEGQLCQQGACEVICPGGGTNCGGPCVDTLSDPAHCGACGNACEAGQRCGGGSCLRPRCAPGDSSDGRCEGAVVVRCLGGGSVRVPCGPGEDCAPPAAPLPARCVPRPASSRVEGTLTYLLRPVSPMGVGTPRMVPATGVPVQVTDATSGAVLAAGTTDERGAYALAYGAAPGAMVRLRAVLTRSDGPYNFAVRDSAGATHAFATAPFAPEASGTRSIAVDEAGNAGAIAIYDVVRRAFDVARPYITGRPVALYVSWERGRGTALGSSSYFSSASGTIFINGSSVDPDEYDPSVIAHEFGHYFQRRYARDSSPGGRHDGSPTDPNLAFSEGWATFFSTLVTGTSFYIDAGRTSIRILRNIAALPTSRTFLGDPSGPLTQPLSEYLVAGTQYTLYSAGTDRSVQAARTFNVLTRYLRRTPPPDRAEPGVDLVDFLDGYLCVNMEADRATIERYLVTQRRFPYDFDYRANCR